MVVQGPKQAVEAVTSLFPLPGLSSRSEDPLQAAGLPIMTPEGHEDAQVNPVSAPAPVDASLPPREALPSGLSAGLHGGWFPRYVSSA
jgi:hypothetical protein